MEIVIIILGIIGLILFLNLCNDISEIKKDQRKANRLQADQNNLLREQITIMKGNYKPEEEKVLTYNNVALIEH